MGVFDSIKKIVLGSKTTEKNTIREVLPTMTNSSSIQDSRAYFGRGYGGLWGRTKIFDGEKEKGDIGLLRNYEIDYTNLSRRANEALLVDTVARSVIQRYTKWIVSKGLQLEYKPKIKILELNNINWSTEKVENLNDTIEAYFDMWAKSNKSSFRGNENFYKLQKKAFKSAIANGDVLVVLRYSKIKGVTVELIDSQRLINPETINDNENWKHGVLRNENGEVKKFCIKTKANTDGYTIINAVNSQGIIQAFLFSMDEHRVEDVRGLSKLSASLNKLSKLDRYTEATVGSAEERAKIPYTIESVLDASRENPIKVMRASMGGDDTETDEVDITGEQVANTISATTGKQVFFLPEGQKLVQHTNNTDVNYNDFYQSILNQVAADVGIPPNVVQMLYNDSFSASRAAINDWHHTILVDRTAFTFGFLLPIFTYWFRIEIAKGTIDLPEFKKAIIDDNFYLIEAFTNVEFVGEMFPHIDPIKEIKAEREKLGPRFRNVPLTTHENATRKLGNSDSRDVIQQATEELKQFDHFNDNMEHIESKFVRNVDNNE